MSFVRASFEFHLVHERGVGQVVTVAECLPHAILVTGACGAGIAGHERAARGLGASVAGGRDAT
jgi:hypothetical protein